MRNASSIMLRNVLIITTSSGLVVYGKDFANPVAQPRLIGSLLTAMLEFCANTTGGSLFYIELAAVSVSLVRDDTSRLFCALFHDRADGSAFGRLVASQILAAFVDEVCRRAARCAAAYGRRPCRGPN